MNELIDTIIHRAQSWGEKLGHSRQNGGNVNETCALLEAQEAIRLEIEHTLRSGEEPHSGKLYRIAVDLIENQTTYQYNLYDISGEPILDNFVAGIPRNAVRDVAKYMLQTWKKRHIQKELNQMKEEEEDCIEKQYAEKQYCAQDPDYSFNAAREAYGPDTRKTTPMRDLPGLEELIKAELKKQKPTFKKRLANRGKKALSKAIVRKVCRKLTQGTQGIVTNLLAEAINSQDPGIKKAIGLFLASDIGRGFIAGALVVALEALPLPLALGENAEEIKDALTEELSVIALDEASAPLERVAGLFLPMAQQALMPLLAGQDVKKLKA